MSGPERRVDREAAARAIDAFLLAVGAPQNDPELEGTGARVAAAWIDDMLAGYSMSPSDILSERTASKDPGLVVLKSIATTTLCPHHLLPAAGVAHVGYLPGHSVVGLGALARLVDCYARRLTLQETLGSQIANALVEHAGARGAACMLDLAPMCSIARGERRHGARAVTVAWAGSMCSDVGEQAQWLAAIGGGP